MHYPTEFSKHTHDVGPIIPTLQIKKLVRRQAVTLKKQDMKK